MNIVSFSKKELQNKISIFKTVKETNYVLCLYYCTANIVRKI